MPVRNSGKKESPPVVTLRRSPRILQIKQLSDLEDPKTPNPQPQRRTRVPSSATPLTVTEKRNASPRRRSRRSRSKECFQELDGSSNARKSDNLKTESRRSTRLNPCADACNSEKSRSSSRINGQLERRVTRSSSCCRDVDNKGEKIGYGGFTGNLGNGCSSGEQITEEGVDILTPLLCNSPKNKVNQKKNSYNSDRIDELALDDDTSEGSLAMKKKTVLDEELSEKGVVKRTNGIAVATAAVVYETPMEGKYVNKIQKCIGVKRTRNQFENTVGVTHGWTKDQELALERAYLEAKPTPHFWKKVSRLVPGKSAQECFDKVHGSHLTPPQPRPRSRSRISDSQNPSFSASKLLNSSSPAAKRPRLRRQKSHVVQRNVRHMLQKQHKVEKDSEADLFSVLEPTFTQSLNCCVILTTPDRNQETGEMLGRCQERSSTAHKKSLSRLGNRATLMSPPVLKQVKNIALHEKYIDQLHCKEANRKAACAKAEKLHQSNLMKQESSAQRKDAIRAAKDALVFDARDAINEFQHHQATALSFDDESGADVDEEEGEDFM